MQELNCSKNQFINNLSMYPYNYLHAFLLKHCIYEKCQTGTSVKRFLRWWKLIAESGTNQFTETPFEMIHRNWKYNGQTNKSACDWPSTLKKQNQLFQCWKKKNPETTLKLCLMFISCTYKSNKYLKGLHINIEIHSSIMKIYWNNVVILTVIWISKQNSREIQPWPMMKYRLSWIANLSSFNKRAF